MRDFQPAHSTRAIIKAFIILRHTQCSAAKQRTEDIQQTHVEAERSPLEDAASCAYPCVVLKALDDAEQGAVRYTATFGLASRSGGETDVSQIVLVNKGKSDDILSVHVVTIYGINFAVLRELAKPDTTTLGSES